MYPNDLYYLEAEIEYRREQYPRRSLWMPRRRLEKTHPTNRNIKRA